MPPSSTQSHSSAATSQRHSTIYARRSVQSLPKLHIPPYAPPYATSYYRSARRPPKLKRMAVPQRLWKPTMRAISSPLIPPPPVTFDLVDAHASYGLPISFVTSENVNPQIPNMVQNSDDLVLEGLNKISLRIQWPGYEHVDWVRTIGLTTSSGRMTRGELAEEVVRLLWYFFDRLSYEVVNPSKRVWAVGRGQGQWSIENIILVALHCCHKNTFQPELQLYFPHQARAVASSSTS